MSKLIVERFVSPPLETNVYVAADEETGKAVVIDPSFLGDQAAAICEERGWTIEDVLLTHSHVDHSRDAAKLARMTGRPPKCRPEAAPLLRDPMLCGAAMLGLDFEPCHNIASLEDGDIVRIGDLELRVMHTPGHSIDGLCLAGEGVCFTGDLLFRDSVGRHDLPGGDPETLRNSLRTLCDALPGETVLYPGHGPSTVLDREKRENPFLLQWL